MTQPKETYIPFFLDVDHPLKHTGEASGFSSTTFELLAIVDTCKKNREIHNPSSHCTISPPDVQEVAPHIDHIFGSQGSGAKLQKLLATT